MATHQEVISTTEQLIDSLARTANITQSEAMSRYFAENPGKYQLYDRACQERVKATSPHVMVEPTPERRTFREEGEFMHEVDREMRAHNLSRPDAIAKVATEQPELYVAYDRRAKRPGSYAEPTTEMNPGERRRNQQDDDEPTSDMMRLAQLVDSGQIAMAKILAAKLLGQ